jgi:tetratricopeptide (TPR) repeat protein
MEEMAQRAGDVSVWNFIRGAFILVSVLLGLGWIFYRWLKKSADDPVVLILKWIATGVLLVASGMLVPQIVHGGMGGAFLLPMLALNLTIIGVMWGPNIAQAIARPLTSALDGGSEPPELRPCYSAAIAKRNRGATSEAIGEVRKQLECFPNDYDGIVMIATMQAEDLNDLDGACWTLESAIHQPKQSPGKIVNALYLMADWRMKYGLDPDSARAALQRVIELVPNSPTAQKAAQRIAHLGTVEHLIDQHDPTPIAVPHYQRKSGRVEHRAPSPAPESDPEEEAGRLIAQLEQHPLDADARERLAFLYAAHYQRLDLATHEIEELISVPGMPQKNLVRWLNLLADFSIQFAGNQAAAEEALLRVIDLFPESAAAEQAQSRLTCLAGELTANKKSQSIPLGSYEKNLGLKKL